MTSVAWLAVAPVLVTAPNIGLVDAEPVDTGTLGTRLDPQLLTVLANVLGQTRARVVARLRCLLTRGTIETRRVLALIVVSVAQVPGPAQVTGAGVVTHTIHTLPVLTLMLLTLVNVDITSGPGKTNLQSTNQNSVL